MTAGGDDLDAGRRRERGEGPHALDRVQPVLGAHEDRDRDRQARQDAGEPGGALQHGPGRRRGGAGVEVGEGRDEGADPRRVLPPVHGCDHRARDAPPPEARCAEPPCAGDAERSPAVARCERRVHREDPAHALGCAHRRVDRDLPTPGAAGDEGPVEPERVHQLEHDAGVPVRLHVPPRRVAPAEARAVDADDPPGVGEQRDHRVEQAVVAEQRRPEQDRRPRRCPVLGDRDRPDRGRDPAQRSDGRHRRALTHAPRAAPRASGR